MRANGSAKSKTEKAGRFGPMDQAIMATGLTICQKVMVSIVSPMVNHLLANSTMEEPTVSALTHSWIPVMTTK